MPDAEGAHLRDLRYFLAVADELSFTRAAAALFVAQPALSKRVRALETGLGVELFTRGHRSIALTAAGASLVPHARRIVAEWDAAMTALRSAGHTITVGFHTRIARGLMPAITATMQERLPGWRLRFRQVPWGDPTVGLGDGTVDVAIAWLPVPGDKYAHRVAATEQRWVALPVDHPLAAHPEVPFAHLLTEPFVALPASAGPMREFWLATDQRPGAARIGAEATTAEEAFEAVAAGAGVALVAAGNADLYRRDDVVCRPVPDLPPAELAVLWRRNDTREAVTIVADASCRCMVGGTPG
jgi:DNA-binding transcriptional LysR family regulator